MAELSFDTPTMAELYFKQGHRERAIEIYRKVVALHPDNVAARARLQELSPQGDRMSFREHIQRIVDETPGAVACTLSGWDGIAIDTYQSPAAGDVDIANLLVEHSAATQQLRRSATEDTATGAFSELAVGGSKLSTIFRPINDEFYLAVVLSPSALSGKARFLMRLAVPAILRELA